MALDVIATQLRERERERELAVEISVTVETGHGTYAVWTV